ncbi:MAG: hypothetical protein AAFO06_04735 [Cyanobacteria bacterium J06597_16]
MSEIKIFLASSSELRGDREQFEIFINRRNKALHSQNIFLNLVIWEDFLDTIAEGGLQSKYNEAIKCCDIFVVLVHNKLGKHTAEEFESAFGQFSETSKPRILTYFKKPWTSEDREGINSLWDFKDFLEDIKHYPTEYETTDALKKHFWEQLDKLTVQGLFNPQMSRQTKDSYLGQDKSWESVDRMLDQLCIDMSDGKFLPAIEHIQMLASFRAIDSSLIKDVTDYIRKIRANYLKSIPLEVSMAAIKEDGFIGANHYRSSSHLKTVVGMVEKIFAEADIYFTRRIEIPIVLYVMTDNEAKELDDSEDSLLVPINGYRQCITGITNEFSKWDENYQASSIRWQPFRHRKKNFDSIENIVTDAVRAFEKDHSKEIKNTQIHLNFKDVHDVSDDRELLQELRENPCVLVIDSISLYHPILFKKLKESMLDASSNTFVCVLYPSSSIQDIVETIEFSYNISFSDLEISKIRGKKGRFRNMFRHDEFSDWLYLSFESNFLNRSTAQDRGKIQSNPYGYFNKFSFVSEEE